MKPNYNRSKLWLRLMFVLGVGAVPLLGLLTSFALQFILIKTEVLTREMINESPTGWIVLFLGTSTVVGLSLSPLFSKIILKPVNTLIDGMGKLSEGDYSTRIHLGKVKETKALEESFNGLAKELESVEILRGNFVNDFSHELKTPIVSISGLISLMKTGKLTPEKQAQYLNVIDEEVKRLTNMTTNILTLSKLEKQTILTDKKEFNLSEQIRDCVLLLENKWTEKNLELNLEMDEHNIVANEDMLKHVWMNLIDNAVKFSSYNGLLKITVTEVVDTLKVSVENGGRGIPQEEREKIFTKFYQTDRSRTSEGNGIGLSIVKHVVDLHHGKIEVSSEDGLTVFTVTLPKNMPFNK